FEHAEDKAEEQRLFYVGITRAKDLLFLTRAARRRLFGEMRERAPSPYLQRLNESLLDRQKHDAKRKARQMELEL
ncbi:hypothetical protein GX586_08450, partial [bacterium]|nr:hypothetical protein [bacterium]